VAERKLRDAGTAAYVADFGIGTQVAVSREDGRPRCDDALGDGSLNPIEKLEIRPGERCLRPRRPA
jgi:hypothetical protein